MRVVDGTGRRGDGAAWGLPGSLLLHAPLIAAIALVPVAAPMRPAPVAGIVVELLSAPPEAAAPEGRAGAATRAPAAALPARRAPPPATAERPQDAVPAMIRAQTMLSAKALADPRSRQARAALAGMDDGERRIQLCNIEAMSQLQAWRATLAPDQVVAYATADVVVAGATVAAAGAAFRSGGRWFALRYRCAIAAGGPTVDAFDFLVGDAIPRDRWEDYGLADDADGAAPLD